MFGKFKPEPEKVTNEKVPHEKVPHFEELNSLGIKWNAELIKYGYKYTFNGVKKIEDKYYLLESSSEKVLFSTLHYNEDNGRGFLHPDSQEKTDFENIISCIRKKFPDINKLILSACYPTYAKKFIEDSNNDSLKNIIFLGNNDREYSLMFYPKKATIEVIPTSASIDNPNKS